MIIGGDFKLRIGHVEILTVADPQNRTHAAIRMHIVREATFEEYEAQPEVIAAVREGRQVNDRRLYYYLASTD